MRVIITLTVLVGTVFFAARLANRLFDDRDTSGARAHQHIREGKLKFNRQGYAILPTDEGTDHMTMTSGTIDRVKFPLASPGIPPPALVEQHKALGID